jgi:hypothetical protein
VGIGDMEMKRRWIYILVLFMVIPNMVFGEIIMPKHRPLSVFDDLDSLYNKLASGLISTKSKNGEAFAVDYLFSMASVIAEFKFKEIEEANPRLKKITRFDMNLIDSENEEPAEEDASKVESNEVAPQQMTLNAEQKVHTSLKLTSSVQDKAVTLKYSRGSLQGSTNYLVLSNEIKFSASKKYKTVTGQVDYNYTAKEITASASKSITANLDLTVSAKNKMDSKDNYTGLALAYRF